MKTWNDLSIREKSAMMRTAIRNGITTLSEIKKAYNEFAMGGPENDLIDRVIQEEGFLAKPTNIGDGKMTLGSGLTASKWHKLYNQKGEWTEEDNQKAVAEELEERRKWAEKDVPNWNKLPQDSQNALLSYKYNFDFNRKNSPKLYKALSEGDYEEAARQINATSKNPKFKKGLMARRQREQEWFLKGLEQVAQEAEAPVEQVVENASVYNPPQSVIDNIIANNGKYMITGTPPLAGTKVPVSGIADGLAMQDRMAKVWKWIKDFNMLEGLENIVNKFDGETEPTQQMRIGRRPIITRSDGTDVPGYDYFGNQIWTMTDGNKAEDIDYDVNLPDLVVTPQNNLDLAGVVNEGMNKAGNVGYNIADLALSSAIPAWGIGSGLYHGIVSAKDIKENGLNWNNGLSAVLGMGIAAAHIPTAAKKASSTLEEAFVNQMKKLPTPQRKFYFSLGNDIITHPIETVKAAVDGRYIHDYSSLRRNVENAMRVNQKAQKAVQDYYTKLTGIDIIDTNVRPISWRHMKGNSEASFVPQKMEIKMPVTIEKYSNIRRGNKKLIELTGHESTHAAEQDIYNLTGYPNLGVYDDTTGYYIPNKNHPIAAKYYSEFMKGNRHGKYPEETWANYIGAKLAGKSDLRYKIENYLSEGIFPPKGFLGDYYDYLQHGYWNP